MTDVVMGAIKDYKYNDIEPWIVSLEQSGFEGIKVLLAYNLDLETKKKIEGRNILVIGEGEDDSGNITFTDYPNWGIMTDRFIRYWQSLGLIEEKFGEIENVIITDVKDVIFQENPSKLFEFFGDKIVVGSEGLTYEEEPWGNNNLRTVFGEDYFKLVKDREIVCAGVICGTFDAIRDLTFTIYEICRGKNVNVPGGGGPDQACLNMLLAQDAWKNVTEVVDAEDDFIVHLGTSLPAIQAGSGMIGEMYKDNSGHFAKLIQTIPMIVDEKVCNLSEKPYMIVHQYNRVPEINELVERKYREAKT
jgi:hypothetical protein